MIMNFNKTCLAVLEKYGKSERDVEEALEILLNWRKNQPHLPQIPIDEVAYKRLGYSLVNSKFNLDRVKRAIDVYYSIKNSIPEFFDEWDPLAPEIQNAMRVCGFLILPKLTPSLNKVVIMKFLDSDPDHMDPIQACKMALMFSETRILCNEFTFGDHYICDISGLKFAHITKATPSFLKKWYLIIVHAYILRLFGVHFINSSPYLNTIIAMLKPFFKPKLYDRIHVHENLESLHKIIPKDILPIEYGGTQPSYQVMYDAQIKEMESMRECLITDNQYRTDESKRLCECHDDLFGSIHGTFRQLSVD